tara:strand:- start:348 stop:860 length:513 start_codon:yes stop_codon:yes gene_type:complete
MRCIKNCIEKLDILVVSCGGVGSNYICDLLYDNDINVNCRRVNGHGIVCHLCKKIIPLKKCIYIYGDYEYAIKSQERRKILQINLCKIKKNYKGEIPSDDPFLYKYQYENFKSSENTYLLKYPYSKEDLINCFKFFNIQIDENKIEIKERETNKDFISKYENQIKCYLTD